MPKGKLIVGRWTSFFSDFIVMLCWQKSIFTGNFFSAEEDLYLF